MKKILFHTALLLSAAFSVTTFAHTSGPAHAHISNADFSGEIKSTIINETDPTKPWGTLTVNYSRELTIRDKSGGVVGWQYNVGIKLPVGLGNKQRTLSLYSIGLQGLGHTVTVVKADSGVELWLKKNEDDTKNSWKYPSGTDAIIDSLETRPAGLPAGTAVNRLDNIGFIRNTQSDTYSLSVQVKDRLRFGNYRADILATDISTNKNVAGILSGHDNVPPPIPPGSSGGQNP